MEGKGRKKTDQKRLEIRHKRPNGGCDSQRNVGKGKGATMDERSLTSKSPRPAGKLRGRTS